MPKKKRALTFEEEKAQDRAQLDEAIRIITEELTTIRDIAVATCWESYALRMMLWAHEQVVYITSRLRHCEAVDRRWTVERRFGGVQ
jgi:hypothetical protein